MIIIIIIIITIIITLINSAEGFSGIFTITLKNAYNS